jgi:hypothetical protein
LAVKREESAPKLQFVDANEAEALRKAQVGDQPPETAGMVRQVKMRETMPDGSIRESY